MRNEHPNICCCFHLFSPIWQFSNVGYMCQRDNLLKGFFLPFNMRFFIQISEVWLQLSGETPERVHFLFRMETDHREFVMRMAFLLFFLLHVNNKSIGVHFNWEQRFGIAFILVVEHFSVHWILNCLWINRAKMLVNSSYKIQNSPVLFNSTNSSSFFLFFLFDFWQWRVKIVCRLVICIVHSYSRWYCFTFWTNCQLLVFCNEKRRSFFLQFPSCLYHHTSLMIREYEVSSNACHAAKMNDDRQHTSIYFFLYFSSAFFDSMF